MLGKKVLHVLPIHVPILRLVVGSILIAVAISLGTVWGARLSAMRSEPVRPETAMTAMKAPRFVRA